MRPELDEILRGIAHLRKRAARGELSWIQDRYDSGKLKFLRKVLPPGGYERLGRDLSAGDVRAVRSSFAAIDDEMVGLQLGYEPAVHSATSRFEDEYLEPTPIASGATSVFAPIDEPLVFADEDDEFDDPYDDYSFEHPRSRENLVVIADDFDAPAPRPTQVGRAGTRRVVEPVSRSRGAAAPGRAKQKLPLQWILIALAAVVVFALLLSQCGGDEPNTVSTNTTLQNPASGGGATGATTKPGTAATVPSTTLAPPTYTIFFPSGAMAVPAEGLPIIDQVVERIKANPTAKVTITGYADKSGNPTFNADLSQKRANNVRDAIVAKLGTSPHAIQNPQAGVDNTPLPDNEARRVVIAFV